MMIPVPEIEEDFHDSTYQTRCEKLLAALSKTKAVDLGANENNTALPNFLECHTQIHHHLKNCKATEKLYESCHASVMNDSDNNEPKTCEKELADWLECSRSISKASGWVGFCTGT